MLVSGTSLGCLKKLQLHYILVGICLVAFQFEPDILSALDLASFTETYVDKKQILEIPEPYKALSTLPRLWGSFSRMISEENSESEDFLAFMHDPEGNIYVLNTEADTLKCTQIWTVHGENFAVFQEQELLNLQGSQIFTAAILDKRNNASRIFLALKSSDTVSAHLLVWDEIEKKWQMEALASSFDYLDPEQNLSKAFYASRLLVLGPDTFVWLWTLADREELWFHKSSQVMKLSSHIQLRSIDETKQAFSIPLLKKNSKDLAFTYFDNVQAGMLRFCEIEDSSEGPSLKEKLWKPSEPILAYSRYTADTELCFYSEHTCFDAAGEYGSQAPLAQEFSFFIKDERETRNNILYELINLEKAGFYGLKHLDSLLLLEKKLGQKILWSLSEVWALLDNEDYLALLSSSSEVYALLNKRLKINEAILKETVEVLKLESLEDAQAHRDFPSLLLRLLVSTSLSFEGSDSANPGTYLLVPGYLLELEAHE